MFCSNYFKNTTDDGHAIPIIILLYFFDIEILQNNEPLVRLCGDYRIKPHIPLLREFPANCFKFQSCDFTTQVYLILF